MVVIQIFGGRLESIEPLRQALEEAKFDFSVFCDWVKESARIINVRAGVGQEPYVIAFYTDMEELNRVATICGRFFNVMVIPVHFWPRWRECRLCQHFCEERDVEIFYYGCDKDHFQTRPDQYPYPDLALNCPDFVLLQTPGSRWRQIQQISKGV